MSFNETMKTFTIIAHGNKDDLNELSAAIGRTPRLDIIDSHIILDAPSHTLVLKYKSTKEHGQDYFEGLAKEIGVSLSGFEKEPI